MRDLVIRQIERFKFIHNGFKDEPFCRYRKEEIPYSEVKWQECSDAELFVSLLIIAEAHYSKR